MRLVTYNSPSGFRAGVVVDDVIVDVQRLADETDYSTIRSILSAGPGALEHVRDLLTRSGSLPVAGKAKELRLAAPVPDPGKILCVGLNYREHAAEVERELPPYPTLFAKFASSLVGPYDPVLVPPIVDPRVDYEGELGVVIGRFASRLDVDDALDHVAGVCVVNDVTSRRLQYETTQWLLGKAVDGFAPMGPALVTMDEVPDIQNLALRTRVNGAVVQQANTSEMIWSVAELIALISETISLDPGDIIVTGTPAGVGSRRTPPLYLEDGDVVEVEVDGVGAIANTVLAPAVLGHNA